MSVPTHRTTRDLDYPSGEGVTFRLIRETARFVRGGAVYDAPPDALEPIS